MTSIKERAREVAITLNQAKMVANETDKCLVLLDDVETILAEQRESDLKKVIEVLTATDYFYNEEGFSQEAMITLFKESVIGE